MEEIPSKKIERNAQGKISEVPAIEESRNMLLRGRADVATLVEAPLVRACEFFFDKGIRTLASSANAKDVADGNAYIIIDFDNLSPENQEIARTLSVPISYDGIQAIKIEIPITTESTSAEIEQAASQIAERFQKQKATWIRTRTMANMRKIYGIPDTMETTPEDFTGEGTQTVWDPEKQVFYDSEELRLKALE